MKCMKLYYGDEVYALSDVTDWSVTSELGGDKTIQFDIAPQSELYKYIEEEGRIEYDGTYYNIKTVNERRTTATVTAKIDLDGLQGNIFTEFNHTTVSLAAALSYALDGTGWAVVGAGLVTAKRSFELTDVTPLDIINQCTNKTMYNVSFTVDNINHILNVSVPSTVSGNVYFTDRLNLKELTIKGSSSDFATRLYAYGADGLTFADINDGKEYIDDNTYSDKVIATVWRDERYTDSDSLLADAKTKLAELAVPERSYECSIIDLARLNSTEYSDFAVKLNGLVTLVDRRRNSRIEHTVTQLKEYPNDPVNNTVTLSTAPDKISKKLSTASAQISDISSTVNNQPSLWQRAIATATALITGADGGYVVLNPSECPSEILIMDTDDINTAARVWRWNSGGLGYSANGYSGPFTTAVTMDGSIVADFITAGEMNAERITAGTLKGVEVIATTGKIAGWTISGNLLVSNDGSMKLDSTSNTLYVYDDDGNIKMRLNKSGIGFYQDGDYLGFIGTNRITDTDYRGLVFDLDTDGYYMSWGVKDDSSSNYSIKMAYYRESDENNDKGFHFSDDVYISSVYLGGSKLAKKSVTVDGTTIQYVGWED